MADRSRRNDLPEELKDKIGIAEPIVPRVARKSIIHENKVKDSSKDVAGN